MTREQWKTLHRLVRSTKAVYSDQAGGYYLLWSTDGRLGLSRRHPHGHLIAQASIVRVLGYAADSRRQPVDHRIYLDRVRMLRNRGTWL